jgi:hypothetical protein
MIRTKYIRGPGFVALVSDGHSSNRKICEAACAIFLGAAHALEHLSAWNPKEISLEGLAHTGTLGRVSRTADTTAIAKPKPSKYRVIRPKRKKR